MEIKIFVVNLGKYNEGVMQGEWFTLPVDMAEIRKKIGLNERYEEWAIFDSEGPFEIGENESIEKLNEIAAFLSSIEEEECVINTLFKNLSREEALEVLKERRYRVYYNCKNMADVAYEIFNESGRLEEIEKVLPIYYVDWEAIGRDLEIEGFFVAGRSKSGQCMYIEIIQ